jgi:16S rRNA (guanine(966)-N(2))-methyltransferase RsmD
LLSITGGKWLRRRIETTSREVTRYTPQSARKALFDIIDVRERSFMDLFSGSGIISFEAVSRGAARVVCVDVSKQSCRTILNNRNSLDPEMKLEILCRDFRRVIPSLRKSGESFDFVFADPPFDSEYVEPLLKTISNNEAILKPGGLLIVETSTREERELLPEAIPFVEIVDRKSYASIVFTFLARVSDE